MNSEFELGIIQREMFEQEITRYLDRINRTVFRRTQKEAFECCVRCCDAPFTKNREFHDCTEICAARLNDQRNYASGVMNNLRASLERCVLSCKEEGIKMQQKGQHQESYDYFGKCSEKCIQEHMFKLPQIIEEIVDQMQKRFINFTPPSTQNQLK